ncbi:MAG: phosphatidylserine decarboxylase [Campylobacter sp.]|nr:phosphatidylserine decarboxylase [Campylobacter sp.]
MDKKFSSFMGFFGGVKFPKMLQTFINKAYVSYFKIDMSEFDSIDSYENLNALFARSLKKAREFNADDSIFLSPCDSTCLSCGLSNAAMAYSIKGREYSLKDLLGSAIEQNEVEREYDFANFYLSPRDYHHFHAPCDLRVLSATYIPGNLYSVAKSWLKKIDALYTKNERVVLKCEMNNDKIFWLVFIGALNVGKINICFDERIKTNAAANFTQTYGYKNINIKKGEELGSFELGSSIVMICEKDAIELNLFEGKVVKQGESIGKIR